MTVTKYKNILKYLSQNAITFINFLNLSFGGQSLVFKAQCYR